MDLEKLINLRQHAEKNIVSFEDLKLMLAEKKEPVGDNPEFVTTTNGQRVVFSIEDQGPGRGFVRHMSVSNETRHGLSLEDLQQLAEHLGFSPSSIVQWWEETPFGLALNWAQPTGRGQ